MCVSRRCVHIMADNGFAATLLCENYAQSVRSFSTGFNVLTCSVRTFKNLGLHIFRCNVDLALTLNVDTVIHVK